MTARDFYNVLFNEDEGICWSDTPYGTYVIPVESMINYRECFFSINPLKERRLDANVTSYRNILCEFDSGSKEEQLRMIEESGLPFTTLVHSGNKSYHVIISLKTALTSREEYDDLVRCVYDKLPTVDPSGKNPSRFSRAPFAIRGENTIQELVFVKNRVDNEALYKWCNYVPGKGVRFVVKHELKGHGLLPSRTHSFFMFGAPEGLWNSTLFESACEMCRAGFPIEEMESRTFSINGKLDKTDRRTIKSAYDTIRREG